MILREICAADPHVSIMSCLSLKQVLGRGPGTDCHGFGGAWKGSPEPGAPVEALMVVTAFLPFPRVTEVDAQLCDLFGHQTQHEECH